MLLGRSGEIVQFESDNGYIVWSACLNILELLLLLQRIIITILNTEHYKRWFLKGK